MLSVKVVVRSVVGVVVALTLASGVTAQDEADLVIRGIWARATISAQVMGEMSAGGMADAMATPEAEATEAMGGMGDHSGMMNMVDVSAVYFLLENRGAQPIRLNAASTPVAGTVEIHETTMENDVMRMRPLENGITVAPGETAELRQGGLHIMLLGLTAPLVEGSAIPVTLTFNLLNAAGEVEGEPFDILTAAPVMLTAPEPTPFFVSGGWARPTVFAQAMPEATEEPGMAMPGMDVSAGYFTLINAGDSDDTLIAASTPTVMETQLHTMIMEGDVMRMRELEDGVLVPAGGSAVFEPGANHIMFMGLIEPLVEGTAIPLTLTFASGLEVTVALPIYDRAMMAMMGGQ